MRRSHAKNLLWPCVSLSGFGTISSTTFREPGRYDGRTVVPKYGFLGSNDGLGHAAFFKRIILSRDLMRISSVFWLAALLLMPVSVQAQDTAAEEEAAQKAADLWIALVDSADYTASWEAAAPLFQQSVTKEQWAQAAQQARGPLGELKSRSLTHSEYSTSLPNAPEGVYVVLVYTSDYAQLPKAVETVIMRQEGDSWKPVGYYVRPPQ
jgi:hypothetical protein